MVGDVFGNGMLLLKYMWFILVFNYLYIFFDLNFDVIVSYEECMCLFENLWLIWEDYDIKFIFKGGGVFSCVVKFIKLIFEMKKWLGIC